MSEPSANEERFVSTTGLARGVSEPKWKLPFLLQKVLLFFGGGSDRFRAPEGTGAWLRMMRELGRGKSDGAETATKMRKKSTDSVTRRLNYFFNICPFTTINICPTALKICQIRLAILSKWITILSNKKLPKWRNLAKSGHTEHW